MELVVFAAEPETMDGTMQNLFLQDGFEKKRCTLQRGSTYP